MAATWKKLAYDSDVVKHSLATAESDFLVAPSSGSFVKKTLAETKAILGISLPTRWVSGLGLSHAADTEHDITVAAGEARDATDAADIVLTSAITKQADTVWTVGTNQGGMASGESIVMELMTLDVAPGGAGWAVGDTITGVTSTKTCKIIKVLSSTTYYVKDRSGAFTLGEVLTNGTATADQGAAKPTFAVVGGTLHVWLIKRSDTGVVDIMFSNNDDSGLSPALPSGYDYKRRIGSYRFDASSNIINGDWWGNGYIRTFMYDSPVLDVSDTTAPTSAETITLSVPSGHVVRALMDVSDVKTGVGCSFPYFSSLDSANVAPSHTPNSSQTAASVYYTGQISVLTNTSSQCRVRCINANYLYVTTLGWEDSL